MRGKHTSIDKSLKKTIAWLEVQPGVQKIVLGFSECCRHKFSPGYIKYKSTVSGGIKINGYSGKGVTDIFVRVDSDDNINLLIDNINEKFML